MDFEPELVSLVDADGPGKRRRSRTVIRLTVALGCVLGLVALLQNAIGAAREAARRAQCTCNLCAIKLALHNYHEAFGSLPPAYVADADGKRLHSWRVLILPFMEQTPLYESYDFAEPWDGPKNSKLLGQMPTVFACPSRRDLPSTRTSYVAVTGPGTTFPGAKTATFADVTDGTSNTLLVVEVVDVDVPWTSPRDLDVRTMSFRVNDRDRAGISSKHPGGANVVFADASTRFLRETVAAGVLKALVTVAGGEPVNVEQIFSGR